MGPSVNETIQYARLPEGLVVIRVNGKGTHLNSVALQHVFDLTRDSDPAPVYIVDLDQCESMDSTFMGTLAGMALHQRKNNRRPVVTTNIRPHVRQLLDTLGLKYILDMRPERTVLPEGASAASFRPAEAPEPSRMDRILMMIEAHERLVNIDNNNEVKFENVLKTLRESLTQAKRQS